MIFKRKQIVVLSLVLLIIVAGYLNYSYKKSSETANEGENAKLGEAAYVDGEDIAEEENMYDDEIISASNEAEDYFANAKLERDMTRSRNTAALEEISTSPDVTDEARNKAYDEMIQIIKNSEMEANIEMLIREKGFSDVLTLFGEDGSLDIVVKAPELTSRDVAQIAEIASRQANLDMTKIVVRPVF